VVSSFAEGSESGYNVLSISGVRFLGHLKAPIGANPAVKAKCAQVWPSSEPGRTTQQVSAGIEGREPKPLFVCWVTQQSSSCILVSFDRRVVPPFAVDVSLRSSYSGIFFQRDWLTPAETGHFDNCSVACFFDSFF
jgi:hypothetical protein